MNLSKAERDELNGLIQNEAPHSRRVKHAKILLESLGQRIPDSAILEREVTAWQQRRNAQHPTIHWQFSVEKARAKLAYLYPSLSLR